MDGQVVSPIRAWSTKFRRLMDADTPGLESYDGRCRKVDEHGERYISHLGDDEEAVEVNKHLGVPLRKKLDGPHYNFHQVND